MKEKINSWMILEFQPGAGPSPHKLVPSSHMCGDSAAAALLRSRIPCSTDIITNL